MPTIEMGKQTYLGILCSIRLRYFALLFGSELLRSMWGHVAVASMASSELASQSCNPEELHDKLKSSISMVSMASSELASQSCNPEELHDKLKAVQREREDKLDRTR